MASLGSGCSLLHQWHLGTTVSPEPRLVLGRKRHRGLCPCAFWARLVWELALKPWLGRSQAPPGTIPVSWTRLYHLVSLVFPMLGGSRHPPTLPETEEPHPPPPPQPSKGGESRVSLVLARCWWEKWLFLHPRLRVAALAGSGEGPACSFGVWEGGNPMTPNLSPCRAPLHAWVLVGPAVAGCAVGKCGGPRWDTEECSVLCSGPGLGGSGPTQRGGAGRGQPAPRSVTRPAGRDRAGARPGPPAGTERFTRGFRGLVAGGLHPPCGRGRPPPFATWGRGHRRVLVRGRGALPCPAAGDGP